jgi:hypothetical protein
VQKIREVAEAAEAYPEVFGHLPERMDKAGKVDGVYREFMRILIRAGLEGRSF